MTQRKKMGSGKAPAKGPPRAPAGESAAKKAAAAAKKRKRPPTHPPGGRGGAKAAALGAGDSKWEDVAYPELTRHFPDEFRVNFKRSTKKFGEVRYLVCAKTRDCEKRAKHFVQTNNVKIKGEHTCDDIRHPKGISPDVKHIVSQAVLVGTKPAQIYKMIHETCEENVTLRQVQNLVYRKEKKNV